MKIALIGNMNNNNFALLRYFLDLGVTVDLFLMSDDGIGSLSHFNPSCDSWNVKKYIKHIKYLDAPNRFVTIIGNDFPWNIYFWLKYFLNFFNNKKNLTIFPPPNYSKIKKQLSNYQIIIGSGVSPALFEKINLKLDVFYPYSMGIELVQEHQIDHALKASNFIRKFIIKSVRNIQIKGIKKTKKILCVDGGITKFIFKKINVETKMITFPFIYKEEKPQKLPKKISEIIFKLSQYDISFISHTRHCYINRDEINQEEYNSKHSKHNDWIIYAYDKFIKKNKNISSILLLSEYGEDVIYSKKIIDKLKLNENIIWMPQMKRKELLEIIPSCDVGIGEFYQTPQNLWGGCGLEIMASGKPLIHSFKFNKNEFQQIYGCPPPPICIANTQESIYKWLDKFGSSKKIKDKISKDTLDWFNEYDGKKSAKRILDICLDKENAN